MAFYDKFPYTNFQEINLDKIIKTVLDLKNAWESWYPAHEFKFADPINWDGSKFYEISTIVLGPDGDSYISTTAVPPGVALNNDDYWKKITDYNAQIQEILNRFETLPQFVTPEQFGAVGDGVTNDYQAFYDAIMSIKHGGCLILDGGKEYFIASQLEFTEELRYVSIVGAGQSTIIYDGPGAMLRFHNRFHRSQIKNIRVVLNKPDALFVKFNYTCHQLRIDNVMVEEGNGFAEFNTGTYVHISNCSYSSINGTGRFGIRIGHDATNYTTEFFYIDRCNIDFHNHENGGTALSIHRMNGGLWVSRCDFCNIRGRAVEIIPATENTIAYLNFDNNNISGCYEGFYIDTSMANVAGLYINNQRISLTTANADNRYIKVIGSTNTADIHVKNLYIRTRNEGTLPTYLMELVRTSTQSEIEITSGEAFNAPIYVGTALHRYYDFRNYASIIVTSFTTGDIQVPISQYKTLEIAGSLQLPAIPNAVGNPYFISSGTDENGIPIVNIRIPSGTSGRLNILLGNSIIRRS